MQPRDVAAKTADARLVELPKAELMQRAAKHGVAGRSRMTKDALVKAFGHPA
ncbi:MAG: hypothetical protein M3438_08745 [Pseudomonadota bacterium]|nr:hypothetical protein [Pseudomonadota bacterium]